jgi:hypothetical protein
MPEPENFAIYVKASGECIATQPTLRRAFDYITDDLCKLAYVVEVIDGLHVLTFTERTIWRPVQVISDKALKGDAWTELMLQALDGRLKGFAAMPVRDFYHLPRSPRR